MTPPEMLIVAGPPGAGKSSVFPLRKLVDNSFNADDRAAALNGGSYRAIPLTIRQQVNREFERFVADNIGFPRSFALETTLRSNITFEQAKHAKSVGFQVSMIYVALDGFALHLERVRMRTFAGGHAASGSALRKIYESSLKNLPIALNPAESGIDEVRIFDNTLFLEDPRLVLSADGGQVVGISNTFPLWLRTALGWSELEVELYRAGCSFRD